jgi:hypothetical protein
VERNTKESALKREEFHERLRAWQAHADVGDEVAGGQAHARAPWVWVKHLGNRYYLHADASYEGVTEYLALVERHGESMRWSVLENERGNLNKAAFGPDQDVIPGFYLYRA